MKTLQDLLQLSENAIPENKDIPKALTVLKKALKSEIGKEQATLNVAHVGGNHIQVHIEFNRVLDKDEFDRWYHDIGAAIEKADESGRWTHKDVGSYFADPGALKPKRGQMIDGGALLCDIEFLVTVPNTIRKR